MTSYIVDVNNNEQTKWSYLESSQRNRLHHQSNLIYPTQPIQKEPTIYSDINTNKSSKVLSLLSVQSSLANQPSSYQQIINQQNYQENVRLILNQFQYPLIERNLLFKQNRLNNLLLNKIWDHSYYIISTILFIYISITITYDEFEWNHFLLLFLKILDIILQVMLKQRQNHWIVRKIIECYKEFLIFDLLYIISILVNKFLVNDKKIEIFIFLISMFSQIHRLNCIQNSYNTYLYFLKIPIALNYLICLWDILINNQYYKNEIDEYYISSAVHIIQQITFNSSFQPITIQQCYGYMIIILFCLIFQTYIIYIFYNLYTLPNNQEKSKQQTYLSMITKYFSKYQLKEIKLQECVNIIECDNDEIIFQQNDQDDCALYLIISGEYQILDFKGNKLQKIFESFGEIGFYTQQPRTASIQCTKSGRLLKIDRNQFIQQLNQHDLELFYQQQNQILYQAQYPEKCLICRTNSHYFYKCPKIQYFPNITQLINENNQINSRIRYFRKRQRKSQRGFEIYQESRNNPHKLEIFYQDNISSESSANESLPYDENTQSLMISQYLQSQQEGDYPNNENNSYFNSDHKIKSAKDTNNMERKQEQISQLQTPNFRAKRANTNPNNPQSKLFDSTFKFPSIVFQQNQSDSSLAKGRTHVQFSEYNENASSKDQFNKIEYSSHMNFDLDCVHEFQVFFPSQNITKILKNINENI